MENKKFDAVKETRSIRDKNYEETKDMSRKKLLERYKQRGNAALDQLKRNPDNRKVSS